MLSMSRIMVGAAAAALVTGCATPQPNPGPCPQAFALYDASRVVALADGRERFGSVGFTAEIQAVRTLCQYERDLPIRVEVEIDMGFGRGPAAEGRTAEYTYWVAVTRTNVAVITKEYFPITVRFDADEDIVYRRETIEEILIPRAGDNVSGTNFEILVGFEVTPEQLAFNREGKRFTLGSAQ